MKRVLAIILGGGAGTRLYPLTKTRAKPAVPLAGTYRLIDIPISNCINSEINKIYVLTQFNSASLNRHLTMSYNLSAGFGQGFVEVLAAQQTPDSPSWFEGTADAVRKYQWLFQEWDVDHYLILSGDQLYRMDYSKFVQHHVETGAQLSVGALPVDAAQAEEFGLMRTTADGRIREFREKPKGQSLEAMRVDTQSLGLSADEASRRPFLASMGIYVFSRDTLFDLLNSNPGATDFGKEIIPASLERGDNLQSFLFDDYWEDIGTIRAFYEANLQLASANPPFQLISPSAPIYSRLRFLPPSQYSRVSVSNSIVADGCRIGEGSIIENSVIGVRCQIGKNVVIRNSILMGADDFQTQEEILADQNANRPSIGIGDASIIEGTIVDKNCRIGAGARIRNPQNIQDYGEEEDVIIRDGIVVVSKEAVLPPGWFMPASV